MLRTKVFEVRDRGTFIVVQATQLLATRPEEAFLIHGRCGHPVNFENPNVMITNLNSGGISCVNPYDWNDRTYQTAHEYITKNFTELDDAAVVDVEFTLGETKEPKKSERLTQALY